MTEPGATPGRRAGYRLLGRAFDYLLHMRPAEWPIMAAHTALGYCLAVGREGLASGAHLGPALAGLLLWVICLNGGTLALNSAFDDDEGDIAYLRAPPPPPRFLAGFGIGLMALGQLGSLVVGGAFALAYACCFVLSVLYSVPPVRLKAVAGADWIVNILGFGAVTPLAGWLATGVSLRAPELIAILAFGPLFGALYPLTQLYQLEEDRRRGDRTLAAALGARSSLAASIGAALLAFAVLGAGAAAMEWPPAERWRWMPLAAALLAWLVLLVPWYRRAEHLDSRSHERGMYLALGAWALTDIGVLAAWLG
ncbi:MAG TPA: UbiA family prenyltransferase [Gemmatimonadales bacterium]